MSRFIFITGGVVSSLGKGIATASLGALLQARGYRVRLRKLDPYLNVDPGTMSPFQHGEVYVTDDGAETDLDLGHYERFTAVDARKGDNITTGQLYSNLIAKERRGDYLGGTVQVIPHVTNLIKEFIADATAGDDAEDFILCEIGGTVGDIEGLPFFEAIRQFGYEQGRDNVMYIHLTLVPYIPAANELKTKPTQHSVKELRSIGIQPDLLLCRADREIPVSERQKIALFCNIPEDNVIPALDVSSIYEAPMDLHAHGFDSQVLKHFGLPVDKPADLGAWKQLVELIRNPCDEVTIALVGKYTKLKDAYKSFIEAFNHSGAQHNVKVRIKWVNARNITEENCAEHLKDVHGVIVPGGFGESGIAGKMAVTTYAREHNIPFFGICLGMQLAVIEYARNVVGIEGVGSSEFEDCQAQVVGLMTEWKKGAEIERRKQDGDLGGTMRLGAYPAQLVEDSMVAQIYGSTEISERHRHRYEINMEYKDQLEEAGFLFSGLSPDGTLPEIVELTSHPWYIAVQFHPEFKSRPFKPHPLFASFVKAAFDYKKVYNGVEKQTVSTQ